MQGAVAQPWKAFNAQLGRPGTSLLAELVNIGDCGIEVGNPANIGVLDCFDRVSAVAELRRRCSE